jgi:hypothetical protein
MTTYPTYPFTYTAIAYNLAYIDVYGGTIGYMSKQFVTTNGATEVTGSTVLDEINTISGEKATILSFLSGYTPTAYSGTSDLTIKAMQSTNTYYTFANLPTTGTTTYTVTFDDDGYADDAVFYIYSATNLNLYNIKFEVTPNVNINNIYVLCDANVKFYSSLEYYGNFISNGFVIEPNINSTLNGTATATDVDSDPGYIVYNTSLDFGRLTIRYITPCFMEGTKILTDNWYVPVEDLQIGDWVMTHGAIVDNSRIVGDDVPMQITNIRKNTRTASPSTSPVVITKNAFGVNKPFEDLYVSPNHQLFNSKGQLRSAKHFTNDTTIFQNPTISLITYYHIVVKDHASITANGVITETYRTPKEMRALPERSARDDLAEPPRTRPPSTTLARTPRS